MKSRTNQPIYNDNGKLAQDMPNTSASDSGKVLGIDESGKVVPVSSGTKLYKHELVIEGDDDQTTTRSIILNVISYDNKNITEYNQYDYKDNGVALMPCFDQEEGIDIYPLYIGTSSTILRIDCLIYGEVGIQTITFTLSTLDTFTDIVTEL